MLNNIPKKIKSRIEFLENLNNDIKSGKADLPALLQVSRDAGIFLKIISSMAPEGNMIEVGTSGGYSTLWIALTAIEKNKKVKTYEISRQKYDFACETFEKAGVTDFVNAVFGDATKLLKSESDVSFCFLDADKEVYDKCFEIILPKLSSGGIVVADNVLSHREIMEPFIYDVKSTKELDSIIIPIGTGMLLARKI